MSLQMESIGRRSALKRLAMLTGGALSASTIAAVISGCQPRPEGGGPWVPRAMSDDQAETLATVADLIIPATDTPGAREAGVHEYIDMMLADFHDEGYRTNFMAGVDALDTAAQSTYNNAFSDLDEADQVALLTRLEASDDPFWPLLKQQVLVGYYTSEVGATQELQYLRVPGRFEGCIPRSEAGNGRTWAA